MQVGRQHYEIWNQLGYCQFIITRKLFVDHACLPAAAADHILNHTQVKSNQKKEYSFEAVKK